MATDLSGLSPEAQEEAARLAAVLEPDADKSSQGDPTDGKPKPPDTTKPEEVPEWVKTFMEGTQRQNDAVVEVMTSVRDSFRTLQGETRRANAPPPKERPDPFANLDKEDPAQVAMAQFLRPIIERMDALEAGTQTSTAAARNRTEREEWTAYLQELAEGFGVDYSEVAKGINQLPTDQLALGGRALIIQQFKEGSKGGEDVEKVTKERDDARTLLRESGVYEQLRAAGGGISEGDVERADRLGDAFQKGDVSLEELEKERKKL